MTLNVIDLVDGNLWESGADGYIVKAGQGMREYRWQELVARALAEGKPYGLYWVQDSRYSPEGHKAAIKAAFPDGYFGALGLWLDIEKPWIGMTDADYLATPYAGYKPVVSVWRGVQAYTGVYPGWYFAPGTWDLIMRGIPTAVQQEVADNCDSWIAHYTQAPFPSMRGKWTHWAMWQWRAEPDYNRVDEAWWAEKIASAPTPPEPPIGGKMYKCTVTWPNGCTVRPAPSTANSGINILANGVVFEASALVPDQDSPGDPLKQWAKMSGAGADMYVAVKYPPGDRCFVEELGVEPPPAGVPVKLHQVDVYSDGSLIIDGLAYPSA